VRPRLRCPVPKPPLQSWLPEQSGRRGGGRGVLALARFD
jgi:hypothetical protein